MLTFPLSVVLIPYIIIVAIIIFFAIVNLQNLVRYRAENVYSFGALLIFLIAVSFIGYFSYEALAPIDWTQAITINFPKIGF